MTDIEQQARKEAEEKYQIPPDSSPFIHSPILNRREGYAAALISERSKFLTPELPPRPPNGVGEDPPRYGLRWNGPNKPLSVPMEDGYWTPFHIAQATIDALVQMIHAERSKPSLMVGFSEEEIEQIVDDAFGDTESVIAFYAARRALRYANTRAVSIDRIMEVVKEATWINDVDLLRERLMKIEP